VGSTVRRHVRAESRHRQIGRIDRDHRRGLSSGRSKTSGRKYAIIIKSKSTASIEIIDMTALRLFDLNLLVAFDALMAEGNVSHAARRVGIG
jgi:hypothetical protein